jgi:tetratricopeptide (TPR) repeat protein
MTARALAALLLLAAPGLAAAADPYAGAARELAGKLPAGAKVCVLPFHYIGAEGSRGGAVVAERLNTELVRDGRLTVLERAQVSRVLDALKLPASGLASAEGAGKAGRLLGADLVISGTLAKLAGGALEFNARAVDPGTGEVKASARAAVKEDWLETMPEAPAGAAGAKAYALCKEGMYALDARRFEEADALFTRAIAEEANAACGMNIPGMALMARSMARQGKAGPQDDAPEENGPPTDFTLKEKERISREAAENEKKLARYSALLKAMPDNAAAYYERGRLYVRMKRYREAVKDLDAAIRLEPGKAEYHYTRGYTLGRQRLYDNALKDFDEAIRLRPGFAEAYNGRGTVYTALSRDAKALAEYDKSIEADGSNPLPWANGAAVLCRMKRYKDALRYGDKAIALDAGFAEGYYWRGAALVELKRYDEAVKALDKAMELSPGYLLAAEKRQEALDRKSGKYEGYARDSDKAMELFNARETD